MHWRGGGLILLMLLTVSIGSNAAFAAENGRFQIINIKRDVVVGKQSSTVSGTMMLDTASGQSWILDEKKGRWVPVGYRNAKPSADVTLTPSKAPN